MPWQPKPSDPDRDRVYPQRRARLESETLEDRILLSATWVDADDPDIDDHVVGGAGDDTLASDGGNDLLEGRGGSDTFDLSLAVDGDVVWVDGGDGSDTLDLTGVDSDQVLFEEGRLIATTDDGRTIEVHYRNLEHIRFGDVNADVLSGNHADGNYSGTRLFVDGAHAFKLSLEGGGTVDFSYAADDGSVTVAGSAGTGAGSVLEFGSVGGQSVSLESVRLDGDLGTFRSGVDVGTLSIDHDADVQQIEIGGGDGRIDTLEYTGGNVWTQPVEVRADIGTLSAQEIGADMTIHGDIGVVQVNDDLTIDSTFTVNGDVGEFRIGDDIWHQADVIINGSVGVFELGGEVRAGSLVRIQGDLTDFRAAQVLGDLEVQGNVASIVIDAGGIDDDLRGKLTIGGNLTELRVGDDIEGTVSIGGDVGRIEVGDDLKGSGDVTVAGRLGELVAGDVITKNILVGGDLDLLAAGTDFSGQLTAGAVLGALQVQDGGQTLDHQFQTAHHVTYNGASGAFTATPLNSAPTPTDGTLELDEDGLATVMLAATDPDAGDTVTAFRIDTLPAHGELLLDGEVLAAGDEVSAADVAAGRLQFRPDADWYGETAFTFQAFDGEAWSSEAATFSLAVASVNDAPVAAAGADQVVAEGVTVTLDATASSDEDGGIAALTFDPDNINSYDPVQQDYAGGAIEVLDDGATVHLTGSGWKSIPGDYQIGPDTVIEFDFRTDVQGELHGFGFDTDDKFTNSRFFKIHGTQNNGIGHYDYDDYAGDGEWQHFRIPIGQHYTGDFARLVFMNDQDVSNSTVESFFSNVRIYDEGAAPQDNGLTYTWRQIDGPEVTLSDPHAGQPSFTAPAVGTPTTLRFEVAVSDGEDTTYDTVEVVVEPVNEAPVATAAALTTAEDTPVALALAASDADQPVGDAVTAFRLETLPEHGRLLLDGAALAAGDELSAADVAAGRLTFAPDADWHGETGFTFAASDGEAWSDPVAFALTVTPVNDLAQAAGIELSTTADAPVVVPLAGSDPDAGDDIEAFRLETLPGHGRLLLDGTAVAAGDEFSAADVAAGRLSFEPDAGWHGEAHFTFRVSDGEAWSSEPGEVRVTVLAGAESPTDNAQPAPPAASPPPVPLPPTSSEPDEPAVDLDLPPAAPRAEADARDAQPAASPSQSADDFESADVRDEPATGDPSTVADAGAGLGASGTQSDEAQSDEGAHADGEQPDPNAGGAGSERATIRWDGSEDLRVLAEDGGPAAPPAFALDDTPGPAGRDIDLQLDRLEPSEPTYLAPADAFRKLEDVFESTELPLAGPGAGGFAFTEADPTAATAGETREAATGGGAGEAAAADALSTGDPERDSVARPTGPSEEAEEASRGPGGWWPMLWGLVRGHAAGGQPPGDAGRSKPN